MQFFIKYFINTYKIVKNGILFKESLKKSHIFDYFYQNEVKWALSENGEKKIFIALTVTFILIFNNNFKLQNKN